MGLKQGDLCLVVHQHCAMCDYLGKIVMFDRNCTYDTLSCYHCTERFDTRGRALSIVHLEGSIGAIPTSWLRRVDQDPIADEEWLKEQLDFDRRAAKRAPYIKSA